MDDITTQSGDRKAPLPEPELSIGNIVRLKEPDDDGEGCRRQWGIIVQHVGHNAWGVPKVSLHLYDDQGRLMMGDQNIPVYSDHVASEFLVWKLVKELGYTPVAGERFDLYPTCSDCGNVDQHPFGDERCKTCGGWGRVRAMQRIPQD